LNPQGDFSPADPKSAAFANFATPALNRRSVLLFVGDAGAASDNDKCSKSRGVAQGVTFTPRRAQDTRKRPAFAGQTEHLFAPKPWTNWTLFAETSERNPQHDKAAVDNTTACCAQALSLKGGPEINPPNGESHALSDEFVGAGAGSMPALFRQTLLVDTNICSH
jgi:hypothetical protein